MRFTLTTAAFVTALSATAASAQTELVLTTFFPPQHFMYQQLSEWSEDVEAATDGRVTISIPAGSLAPPPQQYSAVTSGIADISMSANIFLQRKEPLLEFSMLPFLVDDAEAASVTLWNLYESELSDVGMFEDAQLLSLFHFAGGQTFTTDETPLRTVDDFRDRKLWALPGSATDLMVELGLSPVTTPAVQVSEIVTSGVVSGVVGLNFESAVDFRISRSLKTATVFPLTTSAVSFSFAMNADKWASLQEADQEAISALSGAALAQKVGAAAQQAYEDARTTMEAEGVAFHDADEALYSALQEAGQKQHEKFDKTAADHGVDGAALVDSFRAGLEDYERSR